MSSRRDYVPVFTIKALNQLLWNLSWMKEEMENGRVIHQKIDQENGYLQKAEVLDIT